MNVDKMRCALAEVYPGGKWRLKLQQMPDKQVIAIYKNLERRGQLKKKKKKKNEPGIKKVMQITIFDLLEEK